jgi:membrane associated rhomboid family serine protease
LIPYKDDNPTSTFPVVTIALIVLNAGVFVLMLMGDPAEIARAWGAVPREMLSAGGGPHALATVVTSMYLHGGLLHLGGNMLYLWIFGDNIEDRMGHVRFALFYTAAGIVAAFAHAATDPGSAIPMIGASGAVSGVLGAYLMLYPRARVYTILFFFFFVRVVMLPALIVIGFWAIIQFASGLAAAGSGVAGGGSGVAWFAHVGGFLFGVLTIKILVPRGGRRPRR